MDEEKNQEKRAVVTNEKLVNRISKSYSVPRSYLGQKVAILCNRYQYRGILLDISPFEIVLANALKFLAKVVEKRQNEKTILMDQ